MSTMSPMLFLKKCAENISPPSIFFSVKLLDNGCSSSLACSSIAFFSAFSSSIIFAAFASSVFCLSFFSSFSPSFWSLELFHVLCKLRLFYLQINLSSVHSHRISRLLRQCCCLCSLLFFSFSYSENGLCHYFLYFFVFC